MPFSRASAACASARMRCAWAKTTSVVSASDARTWSFNRTKPASSQTGPPASAMSLSAAQATQSSSSAGTPPCGLRLSASLAWLLSFD